jgi:hypothetical protein
MSEIIATHTYARCGFQCSGCPAYKENIKNPTDQQKVSDGWYKYFGFRIPPEEIYCDGCMAAEADNPKLLDKNCPVRPCARHRGIDSCGHCPDYGCKNIKSRIIDYQSIAAKFPDGISDEDYRSFIKPYENRKVLENIQRRLKK